MSAGSLVIKLRCASWQQLGTIYRRDLSRGAMFLKAASPPPVGTSVRIDLMLPSSSVIALNGTVDKHVTDPQRGDGVELKLEPIAAQSVWMIESALAAETKRAATPPAGVPVVPRTSPDGPVPALTEEADMVAAEHDLVKALLAEAESLRKLNPFLVLGVGYEATDTDVRAAFGELTKRYHPDLFARYESTQLRQVAAEIFILIRDAYRRLGDDAGRTAALGALGRAPAPRAIPNRAPTPAPAPIPPPRKTPPHGVPRLAKPAENVQIPRIKTGDSSPPADAPPAEMAPEIPTVRPDTPLPIPPEAIRTEMPKGASQAQRMGSAPTAPAPTTRLTPASSGPLPVSQPAAPAPSASQSIPRVDPDARPRAGSSSSQSIARVDTTPPTPPVLVDSAEGAAVDELLEQGKFDEAVATCKLIARKHPTDRAYRAAVEVCEGLRAMALRDRMEAAQRYEAALEMDPSNERAARELADMRRQATNERKGLLTRLMGKKD